MWTNIGVTFARDYIFFIHRRLAVVEYLRVIDEPMFRADDGRAFAVLLRGCWQPDQSALRHDYSRTCVSQRKGERQ